VTSGSAAICPMDVPYTEGAARASDVSGGSEGDGDPDIGGDGYGWSSKQAPMSHFGEVSTERPGARCRPASV